MTNLAKLNSLRFVYFVLALAVLCPALNAAAGGNGGSYVGPNLGGSSVGSVVERKTSFRQIAQLSESCTYNMILEFWQNTYNADFYKNAQALSPLTNSTGGDGGSATSPIFSHDQLRSSHYKFLVSPNNCSVTAELGADLGHADIRLSFSTCESKPMLIEMIAPQLGGNRFTGPFEYVDLQTVQDLPYFKINDRVADPSLYDAWGRYNPVNSDALVDFQLVLPTTTISNSTMNRSTQIVTKFPLNQTAYARCLRDNFK
jgi:hypothetical protein